MSEKKKTYEEAIVRLEEIISLLENENVSLEEAIKLFDEGLKLSQQCEKQLNEFDEKLRVLLKGAEKDDE